MTVGSTFCFDILRPISRLTKPMIHRPTIHRAKAETTAIASEIAKAFPDCMYSLNLDVSMKGSYVVGRVIRTQHGDSRCSAGLIPQLRQREHSSTNRCSSRFT